MTPETLEALNAARAAKTPAVLVTDLGTGEQALLRADELGDDEVGAAGKTALRLDAPQTLEGEVRRFVHPFNPPLRLVLVGAVHISQPLCRMAADAGYEILVVDPREAFAQAARFEGIELSTDWPDEVLEARPPDTRTAVVTLTHDPKLDDPALEAALKSPAFYIGSLGSRRTHAARLKRLTEAGFDEAALARIHGPVGLAIGARSPAEIAVSILAQITEVLRKPPEAAA